MEEDYRLKTKNFEVYIHTDNNYGSFEHNVLGDECGGGLWFEKYELVDFDGVACLPYEVAMAINQLTLYSVDIDSCCDMNEIKENEC